MRKLILTTAAVAAAIGLAGCGKKPAEEPVPEIRDTLSVTSDTLSVKYGTLVDERDRKKYKTVRIGDLLWMAENLNTRIGNSWCYDDADSKCFKYGRLYDWETATLACPTDWRLPTDQEWEDLVTATGNKRTAGKMLKSTTGWNDYLVLLSGNGTDDYGFSALPGGHGILGAFNKAGKLGCWWTATEKGDDYAYFRSMSYYDDSVRRRGGEKDFGFSVRCLQGSSDSGGKSSDSDSTKRKEEEKIRKKEDERIEKLSDYFTDSRDGRKYRTVEIGGETWMAENLNYETGKSWCYDDQPFNCDRYGRLYDWATARFACPTGWHLPTRQEWTTLTDVDEKKGAGKSGIMLKAKTGWDEIFCDKSDNRCSNTTGVDSPYKNGGGADNYGFSAMPGGFRHPNDDRFSAGWIWGEIPGKFAGIGNSATWWTDTELNKDDAYTISLYNFDYRAFDGANNRNSGYSVRCLLDRDNATEEEAEETTETAEEIARTPLNANLIKFIPAGYRIFSEDGKDWIKSGDLNGDGVDDYVLIIKATDKKMFVHRDENNPKSKIVDRNRRGIMIFFKDGDDYKLVLENRKCFESENEDGGAYFPPDLGVEIKNGNLYVRYGHGKYGGWTYNFQYRDSEFELIGFDYYARNNCNDEKEISINFLTKKQLVRSCPNQNNNEECDGCCCAGLTKETWRNIVVKEPRVLRKIVDFDELFVELDSFIYRNSK
jgi:uncharacterized protein (TIGR02145 family)